MPTFKRKIFYLSGFDPRGARWYHQLYTEQAALYGAAVGHQIKVSDRTKAERGSSRWTIEDTATGALGDLTFLGWDDVIRRHWIRNPLKLLWGSLASTLAFTWHMDWSQGRHFPKGSLLAFYYPGLSVFLLPLLLTLLFAFALGPLAGVFVALAATWITIRRLRSLWLLRFIIFNDGLSAAKVDPGLEKRLDEMADAIHVALEESWDEL